MDSSAGTAIKSPEDLKKGSRKAPHFLLDDPLISLADDLSLEYPPCAMKWTIPILALLLIVAAGAMYLAPVWSRIVKTTPWSCHLTEFLRAQELHQRMTIADLHADSLLWNRNLLRRGTRGHVDLPRLEEGNVSLQAFTVVTQSPRNLNIERNSNSSDLIRYMAIAEGWPIRTWNSYKQRALYKADQLRDLQINPMVNWC